MVKLSIEYKIKFLKLLLNKLLHHLSRTNFIVLKVSQLLDFYIVRYQKLYYAPTSYRQYLHINSCLA